MAHNRPPCDSMIDRLIGNPMPVPFPFVVKNGFKDVFGLVRRQSQAGIADRDQQLTIANFRLDRQLTPAGRFLHRIEAVQHQIHENLL